MELSRIVPDMGHTVVGVASRGATAIEQAEQTSRPFSATSAAGRGQRHRGGAAILQRFDVPVVFGRVLGDAADRRRNRAASWSPPFEEALKSRSRRPCRPTRRQALVTTSKPAEAGGDHGAGAVAASLGTRQPAVSHLLQRSARERAARR
jgi:hypothetical protein